MMRHLQIIADPLEIRGQVHVVHPIRVTNPELNEEIKEDVGELHYHSPDGSTERC